MCRTTTAAKKFSNLSILSLYHETVLQLFRTPTEKIRDPQYGRLQIVFAAHFGWVEGEGSGVAIAVGVYLYCSVLSKIFYVHNSPHLQRLGKFYPQYKAVGVFYTGAEFHVFFIDFLIHCRNRNNLYKTVVKLQLIYF